MSLTASPLSPHNPFKDGLLRVGSRLVHTPIKEETKYPMLVPKGDPNVQAYIRHVHRQERHAGAMHVLCQTRQKLWILQGLQEIKMTIKNYRMSKDEKETMFPTDGPFSRIKSIDDCFRFFLDTIYVIGKKSIDFLIRAD